MCTSLLESISSSKIDQSRKSYRGDNCSDSDDKLMPQLLCDVIDSSIVTQVVEGTRAVIFAASYSEEGGTASQVDNIGLITVAQACIDAKTPSLVIVSSVAVIQPNSPVYQFLNLFGHIIQKNQMCIIAPYL